MRTTETDSNSANSTLALEFSVTDPMSARLQKTEVSQPQLFKMDAFWSDFDRLRHDLSFEFGIHLCMTYGLVELQLRIAREKILKRFKRFKRFKRVELVGRAVRVLDSLIHSYNSLFVRVIRHG